MEKNSVYGGDSSYNTCDLYKAAFLLSAGCKMTDQFRDKKSNRVYFVFERSDIISDMEMKYFKRDAKVDALTYGDNVKSLKSLCHNVKKIGSL